MSSPNRHLRRLWKLPRAMVKGFMLWAMRILMLSSRPRRLARSGFVLPTTTMLLLMLLLTASALTYRALSRSQQTIAAREQTIIVNSATPAVDRAKAKLEYLFSIDKRVPQLPSGDVLVALLSDPALGPIPDSGITPLPNDTYTLPDEHRVDIDGDDQVDNAWTFQSDINGDGTLDPGEWVVYSLFLGEEGEVPGTTTVKEVEDPVNQDKALAKVMRAASFNASEATDNCGTGRAPAGGWEKVNPRNGGATSALERNFQVDIFTVNYGASVNRTVETLEYQQARRSESGNKWGAWFRYDIEFRPGDPFDWNGAIHTEGNIFSRNDVDQHMISSHNSCTYSRDASEITLGVVDRGDATQNFEGQLVRGSISANSFDTNSNTKTEFHLWRGLGKPAVKNNEPDKSLPWPLSISEDSVVKSGGTEFANSDSPIGIAMDPLRVFVEDESYHLDKSTWKRDDAWDGQDVVLNDVNDPTDPGRVYNDSPTQPYIDDFYRADNRWGPRPAYRSAGGTYRMSDPDDDPSTDDAVKAGDTIDDSVVDELSALIDPVDGLDGYWERQAIAHGLSLIVGPRLELGNFYGWNLDPISEYSGGAKTAPASLDPLYPPDSIQGGIDTTNGGPSVIGGGPNEIRQRRTLRDNLAAVQAMAVYHYQGSDSNDDGTSDFSNGEFPLACVALTAHPGTEQTIKNSRTFSNWENLIPNYTGTDGTLRADFFTGNGTNGWEFRYPATFDTPGEFAGQLGSTDALGTALRNLAYFAGDPLGGSPSFSPTQNKTDIHPNPYMAMWGEFSNLRRVLEDLGSSPTATDYNALSPADKTTLHTAACTMGLLAYSMNTYENLYNGSLLDGVNNASGYFTSTGQKLDNLIDGEIKTNNAELTQIYTKATFPNGDPNPYYGTKYAVDSNGDGDVSDSGEIASDNTAGVAVVKGRWAAITGNDKENPGTLLEPGDDKNGDGDYDDPGEKDPDYLCAPGDDVIGTYEEECDLPEFIASLSLDEWLAAYRMQAGKAEADELSQFMSILSGGTQLVRDRSLGFRAGITPAGLLSGGSIGWDDSSGYADPVNVNSAKFVYQVGCDPNDLFGALGGGAKGASARDALVLSVMICGEETPVKYPSLYYLFPRFNHDHDGDEDSSGTVGYNHKQPSSDDDGDSDGLVDSTLQPVEEYIDESYVQTKNNGTEQYKVVGSDPDTGFSEIALIPREIADWKLPIETTDATSADLAVLSDPDSSDETFRITLPTAKGANVALLEKALFDGRENMSVRVLDVNIKLLSTEKNPDGTDYWLSADTANDAEGIVYAFREDAVREDEIVRPYNSTFTSASNAWSSCNDLESLMNRQIDGSTLSSDKSECQMDVFANQDPPLNEDNLISPKPVDFYADPDRRPHGFRLRNGIDFSGPSLARLVGMTFVSDNPVYIQAEKDPDQNMGGFNLHSKDGKLSGYIEEFTETLNKPIGTNVGYGAPFYNSRGPAPDPNPFADLSKDHWRPVEIMSDSLTILSYNFKDGAVEDTFLDKTAGLSAGDGESSYDNQNRPNDEICSSAYSCLTNFVKENGTLTPSSGVDVNTTLDVPVWIDRNGVYRRRSTPGYFDCEIPETGVSKGNSNLGCVVDYVSFADTASDHVGDRRDNQIEAAKTYVNAVFVSNILPSRVNQSYGGFENYPRLIENWSGKDLVISGAFFQFGFSSTATGPFDQDAWEPNDKQRPVSAQWNHYYDQPNRKWGYDVGLQYVPAAPLSRRLEEISSPRSEYYRELPADDPYVKLLRCVKQYDSDGDGTVDTGFDSNDDGTVDTDERIDPQANNCPF